MAKRRKTTETKTRPAPERPPQGGDWLAVFAAAVMFIDDEIASGSLFSRPGAQSTGTSVAKHKRKAGNTREADFGPIVFHKRGAFYKAIRRMYEALKGAQEGKSKNFNIRLNEIKIPSAHPKTFMDAFRRFGYGHKEGGKIKGCTPCVYVKKGQLHASPDAEKAKIVYEALKGLGFTPKHSSHHVNNNKRTPSSPPAGRRRGSSPIALSSTARSTKKKDVPQPSPTTVAETGTMKVGHRGVTSCTDTAAAESIPKLHARRTSKAAATMSSIGRVSGNKNIAPTPIAHRAATTALRIAANNSAMAATSKAATSTSSIRKHPVGPSSSFVTQRGLLPHPKRDSVESSVMKGTVNIAPPALIEIPTSADQYPSLPPAHRSTVSVPWTHVSAAPFGNFDLEEMPMDRGVEEHLQTLLWPGDEEGHHHRDDDDGSSSSIHTEAIAKDEEELSAMSTSSPIIVAVAEDDVSSCPSMKCDDEDAFLPFMN